MRILDFTQKTRFSSSAPPQADTVASLDLQSLSRIEHEWRALESKATSFVQGYDFARAALSIAESQGKRSFLVTVRDGDVLRGVWGLTLERGFHSTLRQFSCGTHEEYCGPLVDDPAIASRVLQQVATLAGIADRLALYNVRVGSKLIDAAASIPFPRTSNPIEGVVILASRYANWNEAEKDLSKAMRYDLRTGLKRLAEKGEVKVDWCRSLKDEQKVLAFYFARKARWLAEQGKKSLHVNRSDVPEFFESLAARKNQDQPLVASVQIDGLPIAAAICFVGPTAVEFHMTTFDPVFKAYSPGKLLIRVLAQWAIDRGLDFDFGLNVYDYKERWPVTPRAYTTGYVALTLRGRIPAADEIKRAARKVAGRAKRWIGSGSRTRRATRRTA